MRRLWISTILTMALATAGHAQKIASCSADKLMARVGNSDTTYIVNFWATWCGPCVAELPQFSALQHHYAGQKVKVLLVSFDFPDAYPGKLSAYVSRKKLEPEVVWFNESNANEFIPKIDASWSGALPGTMVISKRAGFRQFLERPVTAEEIIDLVSKIGRP